MPFWLQLLILTREWLFFISKPVKHFQNHSLHVTQSRLLADFWQYCWSSSPSPFFTLAVSEPSHLCIPTKHYNNCPWFVISLPLSKILLCYTLPYITLLFLLFLPCSCLVFRNEHSLPKEPQTFAWTEDWLWATWVLILKRWVRSPLKMPEGEEIKKEKAVSAVFWRDWRVAGVSWRHKLSNRGLMENYSPLAR